MLKSVVDMTAHLLAQAIIIGALAAYISVVCQKLGRWILIGSGALTFVASSTLMYIKEFTKNKKIINWVKLHSPDINLYTVIVLAAGFLLFLFFSLGFIRKPVTAKSKALGTVFRVLISVCAGIFMIGLLSYYDALPYVMAYIHNMDLAGDTMLSTNFLYRILGMILGLILILVIGIASYRLFRSMGMDSTSFMPNEPAGKVKIFLFLMTLAQIAGYIGPLLKDQLGIMVKKRILRPGDQAFKDLFQLETDSLNYSNKHYFVYMIIAIVMIAVILRFIRNIRIHEDYSNSAERRKIRVRMRSVRRWAIVMTVAVAISTVNISAVENFLNKKPDEVPVEECIIEGNNVYVNLSDVSDGNLHRFGYTTENGIQVRFIVVKKPNSSSYGYGLDACDICGEAGYYQRGDQIVCRRCDVIMNVNTIGFKGGCNPKIIEGVEFSKENGGQLVIPIAELVKHEKDFK